jgi:hypothetical protein
MPSTDTSSPDTNPVATAGVSDQSSLRLLLTHQNSNINQVLQDVQHSATNTNDTMEEPSSKKGRYIKLTYELFKQLMQTCTGQQAFISGLMASPDSIIFPGNSHLSACPAHYTIAKFEEIACRAIKPVYDSSKDQLISFLSRSDIQCQNKGWPSATFITILDETYHLTSNFASVSESDIMTQAEAHWNSPTANEDKHTVDHATYNSRLLAIVIMNSVTNNLTTTLLSHIPHLLCSGGTYLLWSISQNIHRNKVDFTEHISKKI